MSEFEEKLKKAEEKFSKVLDSKAPLHKRKRNKEKFLDVESEQAIKEMNSGAKNAEISMEKLIDSIKGSTSQDS